MAAIGAVHHQVAAFPPAAFIIGAPKCGTTALAQYLAERRDVCLSRPKEPHLFAGDLPGLRRCTSLSEYRACFSDDESVRVLIDASVWHLYSATAVAAILEVRPDARFIVLLRHPVKMLASLHRQLIHALDEDQLDFRVAWSLSEARARNLSVPRTCRAPATLVYSRTAAFGKMIERLFKQVPRERCLVLFQEEMHADTAAVYRRTLAFLGLDDDGRTEFPRVNEAVRARLRPLQHVISRGGPVREMVSKPLKKLLGLSSLGITRSVGDWNSAKIGPLVVAQDLADEIARHYASDMVLLEALLGVDLADFGWPVRPQVRANAPALRPTKIPQ